ncbi:MAG TPA: glycosyltransferase family 1 protein [Solirubrobacteraceae bacterium]
MRVGVDARHLAGGRGVAHYTSELLTALATRFPDDEWRAFAPGRGPLLGSGAQTVRHGVPSRLLFGSAALFGRPRIDRLVGREPDAVWIPAPAPVAVSRDVPYVLTIHDLSWIERPHDFTAYERWWHRLGRLERLAERAAVVVAVSEATKEAIRREWPNVEDVRVIRSGIPSLPPPGPKPPWLPQQYLLAVGALEPRKGQLELKRAFEEARARGLQADLVFAGEGRLARELRGDGVHVVTDADRATLATLYANALALALPSHLEGFGFTALEAARAGIPVMAGPLRVIDETLGDAALRVEDWTAALLQVAGDAELRARLEQAGRERAQRFDWTSTADAMHAVLEEAAART